jgi:hypothetical protein
MKFTGFGATRGWAVAVSALGVLVMNAPARQSDNSDGAFTKPPLNAAVVVTESSA